VNRVPIRTASRDWQAAGENDYSGRRAPPRSRLNEGPLQRDRIPAPVGKQRFAPCCEPALALIQRFRQAASEGAVTGVSAALLNE